MERGIKNDTQPLKLLCKGGGGGQEMTATPRGWKGSPLLGWDYMSYSFDVKRQHDLPETRRGHSYTNSHCNINQQTPGVVSPGHSHHYHHHQHLCLFSSYFNIDCSLASSFFCRSMTPRMILRSSSVRWLRSGISGMAPAAEEAAAAAAAGPGPPRGPCGADIFYTHTVAK